MATQNSSSAIVDKIYRDISAKIKNRDKGNQVGTLQEIQEMLDMAKMILKEYKDKPICKKRVYKKRKVKNTNADVSGDEVVQPTKKDLPGPVLA